MEAGVRFIVGDRVVVRKNLIMRGLHGTVVARTRRGVVVQLDQAVLGTNVFRRPERFFEKEA